MTQPVVLLCKSTTLTQLFGSIVTPLLGLILAITVEDVLGSAYIVTLVVVVDGVVVVLHVLPCLQVPFVEVVTDVWVGKVLPVDVVRLLAICIGTFDVPPSVVTEPLVVGVVTVVDVAKTEAQRSAGITRDVDMFISLFGSCVIQLHLYPFAFLNAS